MAEPGHSEIDTDNAAIHASGVVSSSGILLPKHWLAIIGFVWTGQAVSIISSAAAGYAVVWYVTETTGSALMLSIMTICAMLPTGLLSPFGGIIADRFNRKLIMIVADLSVGLFSFILGLLLLGGEISLGTLIVFAAARSVGQAFHSPAFLAALPMLVPDKHLLRLNMLDQLVMSISTLASPALGIFLYSSLGFSSVMFVDALGAVVAVAGLLFAYIPTVRDKAVDSHVLRSLKEGWDAIAVNRGLLALLLIMLVGWVSESPVSAVFPLMTYSHFHGDGYMASLVEAAYGSGLIAGSLILLVWGGGRKLTRLISLSIFFTGLCVIGCALTPPDMFWLFVVFNVASGVFLAGFNGPLMTLVQREVVSEKLGRAMGLMNAVVGIATPVGVAIAGPLGDIIGLSALFVLCGGLASAAGIVALFPTSIRRLDK